MHREKPSSSESDDQLYDTVVSIFCMVGNPVWTMAGPNTALRLFALGMYSGTYFCCCYCITPSTVGCNALDTEGIMLNWNKWYLVNSNYKFLYSTELPMASSKLNYSSEFTVISIPIYA